MEKRIDFVSRIHFFAQIELISCFDFWGVLYLTFVTWVLLLLHHNSVGFSYFL